MWIRILETLLAAAVAALLVAFAIELWNGPTATLEGSPPVTTPSGVVARTRATPPASRSVAALATAPGDPP